VEKAGHLDHPAGEFQVKEEVMIHRDDDASLTDSEGAQPPRSWYHFTTSAATNRLADWIEYVAALKVPKEAPKPLQRGANGKSPKRASASPRKQPFVVQVSSKGSSRSSTPRKAEPPENLVSIESIKGLTKELRTIAKFMELREG